MDPLAIGRTAVGLLVDAYNAALAANDDKAVAELEALLADTAIGRELVAKGVAAQGVIDAGRGRVEAAAEAESAPPAPAPADPARP